MKQNILHQKVLKGSMLIGIISFVLAVVLGVWRIALTRGFVLPSIPEFLPLHGNVMVGAFLGTLIIFERMFALPIKWLLWVPYVWGISALTMHLEFIGFKILNIISLLGWGAHRFIAYKTFKHFFNPLVEFISYIALSVALLHPGGLSGSVESALAGFSFAIAVIGVERIELTLGFQRKSVKIVYASLIIYLIISILNSLFYIVPIQFVGLVLFLVCVGLIYNDSVIITFKKAKFPQTPLHEFSRQALSIAYAWLLFTGLSLMLWDLISPVAKDVVFHSIGLGFIFTMILAHAPIILGSTLAKMPKKAPSKTLFYLFQFMTVARIIADILILIFPTIVQFWSWLGWISGTLHFLIFVFYILSVFRSFK